MLRYRVFDVFQIAINTGSGASASPVLAECCSSVPLRIYDTKLFPGLNPATPLTQVSARDARSRDRAHQISPLQLISKKSTGVRPHARVGREDRMQGG